MLCTINDNERGNVFFAIEASFLLRSQDRIIITKWDIVTIQLTMFFTYSRTTS